MIDLINQWGQNSLNYFAYIVIQNTIFLGLIFFILNRTKKISAKYRYMIAFAGMIKLFIPHLWPIPFPIHLLKPVADNTGYYNLEAVELHSAVNSVPDIVSINIYGLLFILWLLIAIILIFIPIIATIRLKSQLKQAVLIENDQTLHAGIQLYQSDKVSMPMSIGLFPRKIYIPTAWNCWSEECRKTILRHELAHIERRDGLGRLFQSVAVALYFYHPLVWLLKGRLDELREMACDDRSISKERSCTSVSYSKILVKIAEDMTSTELGCCSASSLIRKKRELYNRIHYQMEVSMKKISQKTSILLIGILLLSAFMLSFNGIKYSSEDKGSIKGQLIIEQTGKPLVGASVIIQKTAKNLGLSCTTDKNGKFTFENISAGTHTLIATANGYINAILSDIIVKNNKIITVSIKIAAQTKNNDEIVFMAFDKNPEPVNGWNSLLEDLIYPEAARKNRIEGIVRILAKIDINGNVLTTQVIQSLEGCDQAAIEAITKTKWIPGEKKGVPVEVFVTIPVAFKLK